MSREEEIKQGLYEHTLNGHAKDVKALTDEALALGMQPLDILFNALIPSLQEVGRRFEIGEVRFEIRQLTLGHQFERAQRAHRAQCVRGDSGSGRSW